MRRLLLAAAIAMTAGLAQAGITTDQVMAVLQNAGYTDIHVTEDGGTIKVEALQNGSPVEIYYDVATGQIIGKPGDPVKFGATATTTGASSGIAGGGDDDGDDDSGSGDDD